MNLGTCSHPGTHRPREFPLKRRTFLAERKSMGIFPVTSRKENSLAMSTVVKTLPDFPLICGSDRRCLTQSPGNSTDSLEFGSNRTSPWSVLLGFSLFPIFSVLTGPGHSPTIRVVHLDVEDCSEELLRQQSYAIKKQLGHPKPPTNTPSLWH